MKDNSPTCKKGLDDPWGTEHPRDTSIQITISVALGFGALMAFCVSTAAIQLTTTR